MSLPSHVINTYTAILREELVPAMGCTEPIAIAYAASILRHALGADPTALRVELSGNIIKNVKSVIVPATDGMHGIEAAVAAGIVAGCPDRKLEVLCALTPADAERIRSCLAATPPTVSELDTKHPFELVMTGSAIVDGHETTARVHLMDRHTNVVSVECDGVDLTDRYLWGESMEHAEPADRTLLNVQDIIAFAEEVDLTELRPLLTRQIAMNMAIAEEGLRCEYGASIGRLLYNGGHCDLRTKARAYAAAGSDARMNGCELPVCIISGSGNQGMTASVPVVVYAKAWGADEDTLLRALLVSNLITVHQKTGIGCLSAYCGAISAGCGCGCGICYLAGGRFHEIAHTLVNAVAILSGTICDGAKASCAAKIAMAVEAGIMGYDMMRSGRQFYGGDGIVTKGVENTIRNIGRLARDGMSETDREIIRIMLGE
ncbi:MAG: serine dehydratase subunit alpha family protein [Clostridia bacterium]|nr:serine dehydratase subunit alpha family protein [Clostridia bacterium]